MAVKAVTYKMQAVQYVFLGVSFLLAATSFAQDDKKPMVLTLKESVLLSLRYNPTVIGAEIQRVVDKFALATALNQFEFQYALTGNASETNSVANGGPLVQSGNYNLLPSISKKNMYGTQYNLSMSNPVTYAHVAGQEASTFYNPSLTLTMTQPLLQGSGKEVTTATLRAAFNNEALARLSLKGSLIDTITTVVSNYWAVVGAKANMVVVQEGLKAAFKNAEQVKVQIHLGMLAQSELVQAEAQVAQQRISVASAEFTLLQAKISLLQSLGLSPKTPIDVKEDISMKNTEFPKGQKAEELLLSNNIAYQGQRLGLQNAKIALLLAEDAQRWSLDLVGTIVQGGGSGGGRNGGLGGLFNGSNTSRNLALALTVPIDNLPLQQQYVSAKIDFNKTQLQARALKISLISGLISSLENLRILRLQVDLSEQAYKLAYKSYLDALKKVQYGQATMFEVTTLQTNYINANIQWINAEISFLTQLATYFQSLGITLDIWDIQLIY